MLTKDLVQATVRSGRLFPKFIKPDDVKARADAEDICRLFSDARGRIVGEFEDEVQACAQTAQQKAFAKLLMDECSIADPGDEVADLRWRIFVAAEKTRLEGSPNLEDFRRKVAETIQVNADDLSQKMFADLPSARVIESAITLSPQDLIDRYNLSHVTTPLCMAQDVCVTLKNLSIQQKRQVMRRLKFQRLMSEVEVDVDSKTLRLDLSGPLKIFGKAQGYSLRIASFFPFVASLPEWTLDATLTWKTKKVTLNLDETCGVQAHSNRTHGGYIPEEFQAVLQSFKDDGEFSLMAGEDFVHIGKQSYCFPDFKVKSKSFDFGIELFHAWHKGQARHRIQTASSLSARGLLIGIERSLLKDKDLKALCESDPWFAKYGFEFTQFPTPNVLKRVLKRYE